MLTALALCAPIASAHAARSVYFAETDADAIAQFSVGAGGAVTALDPASLSVKRPLRLAMTPGGTDLYATAAHGVAQFDVAASGQLTPKAQPVVAASGDPHSIAVHPAGHSVYVTDSHYGKVRQYAIAAGGALAPRDPAYLFAGAGARGLAVSPSGTALYVLVAGGIAVFDIDAQGALTRRPGLVEVASCELEDIVLTPDGRHMYASSRDGRVFGFQVGEDGTPAPMDPPSVVTPGLKPIGIAMAPDASSLYVAASGGWPSAASVLSFGIGKGGLLTTGDAEQLPPPASKLWYLSASPNGKRLFGGGGFAWLLDLGPGTALALGSPPSVALDGARGVVVSPNQAPVARFAPGPAAAGAPVSFDATGAVDPDGTIVRYDWDFGDGTILLDGGPTPTHVYTSPGTYVVTLVVTDNEGASTGTVFTGGTVLGNGTPGAQTTQVITVEPAPPPVEPAQAPQPDLGQTLVASPVAGTVRVRPPGSSNFVALDAVTELPLGSLLDTRRGRVRVSTERRRRGRVQSGVFYGGVFAVRQRRRDRFVTELVLRGTQPRCGTPGQGSAAARSKRRLWGNANGKFRTKGKYSSGAVRGTRWLTEDRCQGTLTVVREGTVAVRDFGRSQIVLVEAGERYLARAP